MKNSYLITGGTGSFGSAFLNKLLSSKTKIQRLVIFSRDELKQSVLQEKYPKNKYPFIRFFLGDIRDLDRVTFATRNIENIISFPKWCKKSNITPSQHLGGLVFFDHFGDFLDVL